jgi:hypothetical protein
MREGSSKNARKKKNRKTLHDAVIRPDCTTILEMATASGAS